MHGVTMKMAFIRATLPMYFNQFHVGVGSSASVCITTLKYSLTIKNLKFFVFSKKKLICSVNKVKFTLQQTVKTQREIKGIALIFI